MIDLYSAKLILLYVGIVFISIGLLIKYYPPKKINFLYGYRTFASMRSQKNWDFSQIYAAKLMINVAYVFIICSITLHLFDMTVYQLSIITTVIIISGTVFLIRKTEMAIKALNQ
jgi:uncharacterized membrane protein